MAAEIDELQDRVGELFAPESAPRAKDDALIERLARDIAARDLSPAAGRSLRLVPRRRPRMSLLVAALALCTTAAAAVVAVSVWRGREEPPKQPDVETTAPTPAPQALSAAPELQPKEPEPAETEPPPTPPKRLRAAPLSAADLLKKANSLRSSGQAEAALAAYRQLQSRYPSSSEAHISRLSAAALLSAKGQHSAALQQIENYLVRGSGGQLAEEALYRKWRTLRALGRSAAARRTYEELRRRFPQSVYLQEVGNKEQQLR